jgi:Zyg-11 family protein
VFLEEEGLDLFLEMLATFQVKSEVVKCMMGLIGNIAELPQLRPHLMLPDLITRLRYITAFSCAFLVSEYFCLFCIAHDVFLCTGSFFILTTSM